MLFYSTCLSSLLLSFSKVQKHLLFRNYRKEHQLQKSKNKTLQIYSYALLIIHIEFFGINNISKDILKFDRQFSNLLIKITLFITLIL